MSNVGDDAGDPESKRDGFHDWFFASYSLCTENICPSREKRVKIVSWENNRMQRQDSFTSESMIYKDNTGKFNDGVRGIEKVNSQHNAAGLSADLVSESSRVNHEPQISQSVKDPIIAASASTSVAAHAVTCPTSANSSRQPSSNVVICTSTPVGGRSTNFSSGSFKPKMLGGWEGVQGFQGWTLSQQQSLRDALATLPQGTTYDPTVEYWARMERIAQRVPGKTTAECANAVRHLVEGRRGHADSYYALAHFQVGKSSGGGI